MTARMGLLIKGTSLVSKHKKSICALIAIVLVISISQSSTVVKEIIGSRFLPHRQLSLYLGDGKCKWEPPTYDVPDDITFTKTLIAGFPSGDKRLTFVQMEGLTGLSARDEWDFAYLVSLYGS